ncbi:LapA family protein [Alkalibacillus aidingensis]|uniref:LapA family protein n=1 Tax=Alkalibacillus aidingensis TaxID=2747607 RepID=UPI001660FB17|nr:lipopolysaccharide assembly protein LapA domain-containing protein [Alkalibacillus aidingensis]
MRQQTWIILTLIFAVIIAVFAVINVDSVPVDFLFTQTDAPLILVILFSVLLGALLAFGVSFTKFYQLQKEVKQLKEDNRALRELAPPVETDESSTSPNQEDEEEQEKNKD